MRRPAGSIPTVAVVLLAHCSGVAAQDGFQTFIAATPPRTAAEQQKLFRLPPGFEIELFACEPVVRKPMNLAFDARGRLWVSESVEYPFAATGNAEPRDRVTILEDADSDGHAERSTVFAQRLNIPIGIVPVSGGALVYSVPNIYRMYDTDGDDRADRREVLYGPFGAADTHGMINSFTWGFDGWLYACHGFANSSEVAGTDGETLRMHSGNTFRMRLDGSRVEAHSRGQVNPFGLSFDPLGDLYASDCHSQPIYLLLRGAYYPSFGKPHDGLGFGPQMCPHGHGSTAIAGIVYYAADHFPAQYRDTIFTGNVVTNRINHDAVAFRGSTPVAEHRQDFLVCDDPWFRPVDIELGPDGALYVADFYNRIIGHYEVPLDHPGRDRRRGRIWRISYRGSEPHRAAATPPRDLSTAGINELIAHLDDANLVVRTHATNQLVARHARAAIDPLRRIVSEGAHPYQRLHSMWALERLDALDAALLEGALSDSDAAIRIHALRVLAGRSRVTSAQHERAIAALRAPDARVRRAAADALGRHPQPQNVRPLLDCLKNVAPGDTHLRHTLRMALRDQIGHDQTLHELAGEEFTKAEMAVLAEVALGAPSAAAARWLLDGLLHGPKTQSVAVGFFRYLAQHLPDENLDTLYALARKAGGDDLHRQAAVIDALSKGLRARTLQLPERERRWATRVARALLAEAEASSIERAIALVREVRLPELLDDLAALADGSSTPQAQRRLAIAALVAVRAADQVPRLGRILADAAEPLALRQHAAVLSGQIRSPQVTASLAAALRTAPKQLATVIALSLARAPGGPDVLLDEVQAGRASARLLQTPVVQLTLAALGSAEVNRRVAALTKELPPLQQRVDRLIAQRREGFNQAQPDLARGAKAFEQHCASCHSIAGKGEKVGPQLDGIGLRGLDRILEDVLVPNQSVDQAFRSSVLVLTSGRVLTGLVTSEEGELLSVVDTEGKKTTVSKREIEQRTVSQLSPMPANFADEIPERDLYDLLSYLLAQRDDSAASNGTDGKSRR